MPSLDIVRNGIAKFTTTYKPTAVFIGATSGIGEGTLQAFARATNGHARIVIVGRDKAKAEAVIATLHKGEQSEYEFVECADASLIKNVISSSAEIRARVNTINYLFMSQGVWSLGGFTPTAEGIDIRCAMKFYTRWKFVDELLPCLQRAVDQQQEARILGVGSAGHGAPLEMDNIGLRNKFTVKGTFSQVSSWVDAMTEEYASLHPGMSFIHIFPGVVNTPLLTKAHWIYPLFTPLKSLFAVSSQDCGEIMTYALISESYKSGAFFLSDKADPVPESKVYVTSEGRAKILEDYKKTVGGV